MKFKVSIQGPRAKTFTLEAKNIKEASLIVKEEYPNHLGYSIKPAN